MGLAVALILERTNFGWQDGQPRQADVQMPVFSGNNDSSPGKQPAQQGNDPYDFPSTGRLLPIRGIATEAGFQLSGPAMSVKVDNAHQLVRIAATKQPELHNHRLDRMDISQLNIGLRAVITRTLKTGVGAADLGVISKGRPDGRQKNRLGDAGGQFLTENTTPEISAMAWNVKRRLNTASQPAI